MLGYSLDPGQKELCEVRHWMCSSVVETKDKECESVFLQSEYFHLNFDEMVALNYTMLVNI